MVSCPVRALSPIQNQQAKPHFLTMISDAREWYFQGWHFDSQSSLYSTRETPFASLSTCGDSEPEGLGSLRCNMTWSISAIPLRRSPSNRTFPWSTCLQLWIRQLVRHDFHLTTHTVFPVTTSRHERRTGIFRRISNLNPASLLPQTLEGIYQNFK